MSTHADGRSGSGRRGRFALALLLLCAWIPSAGAEDAAQEYELKAAFLLNFARLVEWPDSAFESPAAPIRIAVFGDDPFRGALDRVLEGQKVADRPLESIRVHAADEARRCHVVFVPRSETERFGALRKALGGAQVLLVGETKNLAERGAAINFYREGGRLRFEINRSVAERAQLKVSSRLLRLARIVDEG